MTESNYNYVISPNFSANINPSFVEDDEGADRPSTYPVLDGRSKGHGVAPAVQGHGLTNDMVIKYVKADYEELPHSTTGLQDDLSVYTHIDDGSVVVGAGPFYRSNGVAIPDGKQHLVSPKNGVDGKARRRSNPLYDIPVTRFPAGGEYHLSSNGPCGSSWFCCALHTLVSLVAAAALVLSIISIVTGFGGGQAQSIDRKELEDLVERYRNLESNYSVLNDLNRRNSSDLSSVVQELLHTNSELQKTISDLQSKVNRLDAEATNITNSIDLLRKDFAYQISQVSRGLVNLTSCGHYVESSGTSVYQNVTTTNSLDLRESVVLSVVCSTDGGTQAFLRWNTNSPSVYRCECSGQPTGFVGSRYCFIHYWTCPILT